MPHILGNDDHFVSYQDMYTSFTPTKKLKKDGLCADLRILDDPKIAVIQKIAKRRRGHRGHAITLLYKNPSETVESVAMVPAHHCVPLPAVNQYVRHKRSGIWYNKIKHHGGHGGSMVAMSKVFDKVFESAAPSTSSATPTDSHNANSCYTCCASNSCYTCCVSAKLHLKTLVLQHQLILLQLKLQLQTQMHKLQHQLHLLQLKLQLRTLQL